MNKGFSLTLLIILFHLHLSRATSSCKVYSNYKGCSVGEDCLTGNDLDSEFLPSSHAAEMQYGYVSSSIMGGTSNRNGPAIPCRGTVYASCLPSRNGGPKQRCDTYTRGC